LASCFSGTPQLARNLAYPTTGRRTTIPNRPDDMPEGTLRDILRQGGVTPDEFLAA
jgi:hypothetical protein